MRTRLRFVARVAKNTSTHRWRFAVLFAARSLCEGRGEGKGRSKIEEDFSACFSQNFSRRRRANRSVADSPRNLARASRTIRVAGRIVRSVFLRFRSPGGLRSIRCCFFPLLARVQTNARVSRSSTEKGSVISSTEAAPDPICSPAPPRRVSYCSSCGLWLPRWRIFVCCSWNRVISIALEPRSEARVRREE